MKPATVKKMLKLMELPGTAMLLVDGMRVAVNSCGVDLSDEQLVKFLTVLDRRYRAMLEEGKPVSKQRDLEELIIAVKSGKE